MMIEIQVTLASLEEAREIAKVCIEKRWAACAQIIPEVESHYLWKGKLEWAKECKLILKSLPQCYATIEQCVLEKTSYELPEILVKTVEGGYLPYLEWVETSCL
jgi:periplasmic divalent cation tolerance protein